MVEALIIGVTITILGTLIIWIPKYYIEQRKITKKCNYVTKILIETLKNVRSNIVHIPNVYSLYKDFTKILDNNYELNTSELRKEIIDVMISLKMFRTDENNKSSFEYFAKILDPIIKEYDSEVNGYNNSQNHNIWRIAFQHEPKLREVNVHNDKITINSMKPKYIERFQTEFSSLISEFEKDNFKKGIWQHIKERNTSFLD